MVNNSKCHMPHNPAHVCAIPTHGTRCPKYYSNPHFSLAWLCYTLPRPSRDLEGKLSQVIAAGYLAEPLDLEPRHNPSLPSLPWVLGWAWEIHPDHIPARRTMLSFGEGETMKARHQRCLKKIPNTSPWKHWKKGARQSHVYRVSQMRWMPLIQRESWGGEGIAITF